MIDTGALAELLIGRMRTALGTTGTDPLVGDAEVPPDAGWLDGQPGSGVFRPYAVVACTGGTPRIPANLKSSFPDMWAVGFQVRCYGASRKQVDWMAKAARSTIAGLKGEQFGSPAWSVKNLEWVQLGPVLPFKATKPWTLQIGDTVTLVVGS